MKLAVSQEAQAYRYVVIHSNSTGRTIAQGYFTPGQKATIKLRNDGYTITAMSSKNGFDSKDPFMNSGRKEVVRVSKLGLNALWPEIYLGNN